MKTEEFLNALCGALGRAPNSLSLEDTPQTVAEWDSIGHLTIIATVDELLGVPVQDERLREFTSIGELVEQLKSLEALES